MPPTGVTVSATSTSQSEAGARGSLATTAPSTAWQGAAATRSVVGFASGAPTRFAPRAVATGTKLTPVDEAGDGEHLRAQMELGARDERADEGTGQLEERMADHVLDSAGLKDASHRRY